MNCEDMLNPTKFLTVAIKSPAEKWQCSSVPVMAMDNVWKVVEGF
ncbi:Uncharacterised protein [Chlamydia trachomatis]|nr:Uncharacterised protein [Chlamydia trachomatis]